MELSWVYVKVKGEVWKESRAIAQQRHQVTMLDLPNDFRLCHKLNCRTWFSILRDVSFGLIRI